MQSLNRIYEKLKNNCQGREFGLPTKDTRVILTIWFNESHFSRSTTSLSPKLSDNSYMCDSSKVGDQAHSRPTGNVIITHNDQEAAWPSGQRVGLAISSPALTTAWICFSVAQSSNPRPRL